MPAKLKIKVIELLKREKVSTYKLREQSELSTTTTYERLKTSHEGLQLGTLAKTITALEVLLERRVELDEILEIEWVD
jgi:hypothetical protein